MRYRHIVLKLLVALVVQRTQGVPDIHAGLGWLPRGGSGSGGGTVPGEKDATSVRYGRVSDDEYRLTPDQIQQFHRDGCITIKDVLTEKEVARIERVFDGFMSGAIAPPPGKDWCDMSKPYNVPFEEWSLVNCMLPTLQGTFTSDSQQTWPNNCSPILT